MSFEDLIHRVVEPGLCTRCGICAGICPAGVIRMGMDKYPVLKGDCVKCGFCVRSCPGAEVDFPFLSRQVFHRDYVPDNLQGHVENLFVAHSTDERIRTTGTSGGLVTALLVDLLKSKVIDGAVVAGFDPDDPCTMKGILATTTEEVIDAAQSKYCLTASMDALQTIRRKKGRYAVVGLPCQVQGLRKLMTVDPSLAKKIFCIFGLYCHCNMEPHVHLDVLRNCGIKQDDISRFDFRGGGWPGGFHVVDRAGKGTALHSTLYTTILNVLFKIYGAPRCYLCVDALSEYADISFGDFWAHDYSGELSRLERCTLVSQRTERGLEILQRAEENGAITIYNLPAERYSRRIINMVNGKKSRNLARINRMKKKGQQVPEYYFSAAVPGGKARRKELMLRMSFLFRGEVARKLILRLLFSRAAKGFEQVNLYRKKLFCNYHGN
ncbi:MAG: Coenzyme F420 hydrogenase/dehydrogenase, beta subunit C-terminal domain [Thermodesulfobacteriota bacterium]